MLVLRMLALPASFCQNILYLIPFKCQGFYYCSRTERSTGDAQMVTTIKDKQTKYEIRVKRKGLLIFRVSHLSR